MKFKCYFHSVKLFNNTMKTFSFQCSKKINITFFCYKCDYLSSIKINQVIYEYADFLKESLTRKVKKYSTILFSCLFLLIYRVFLQKTRKDISRHTCIISSLLWRGQKNLCMCKILKPNYNWGWITGIQPGHHHQNSQLHLSQ